MAFVIGDYEKLMASRGTFMMTPAAAKFAHSSCGGKMTLTRMLGPDCSLTPAVFLCHKCGLQKQPYPIAPTQGVQPMPYGINYGAKAKEYHYTSPPGTDKPDTGDDTDGEWR